MPWFSVVGRGKNCSAASPATRYAQPASNSWSASGALETPSRSAPGLLSNAEPPRTNVASPSRSDRLGLPLTVNLGAWPYYPDSQSDQTPKKRLPLQPPVHGSGSPTLVADTQPTPCSSVPPSWKSAQ